MTDEQKKPRKKPLVVSRRARPVQQKPKTHEPKKGGPYKRKPKPEDKA